MPFLVHVMEEICTLQETASRILAEHAEIIQTTCIGVQIADFCDLDQAWLSSQGSHWQQRGSRAAHLLDHDSDITDELQFGRHLLQSNDFGVVEIHAIQDASCIRET